jgi:glycopeptide antibiotics resistance protein
MLKRRIVHSILFLAIIPVGLATRKLPQLFHPLIAEYGGDALWAAMFVFLFRAVWPKPRLWRIALGTYLFAVSIEISQLYQASWIDQIRGTFFGRMLLGHGFLWSDLLCYLLGVIFGYLVARLGDLVFP